MMDMQFFGPGSRTAVTFYKTLLEEVQAEVKSGLEKGKKERFRLLWLHYVRPYYPNEIISYLETHGRVGSVLMRRLTSIGRRSILINLLRALRIKCLSIPNGGPLERRATRFKVGAGIMSMVLSTFPTGAAARAAAASTLSAI